MTANFIIGIAGDAVYTILKASAPMLVIALALGLLVSIFQATTQIQEQTLAYVPKIVGVLLAVLFFGPWILTTVYDFAYSVLNNLYKFIG